MKSRIPALLALTVMLSSSCTAAQILAVQKLADSFSAQVALTQTDETGATTTIKPGDVQTVLVNGQTVTAQFTADGQLQLPSGNFTDGCELKVRLRDGSDITMPLKRSEGTPQGQSVLFTGSLHRQAGKVVAADVIPGGQISDTERTTALQDQYVHVAINRPALAGRFAAVGIDQQRLSQDACVVSASGELLINRALLQQYGQPGCKVWAVVDLGNQQQGMGTANARWVQSRYRAVPAARYSLFVLQLDNLSALPAVPKADPRDGVRAQTGAKRVTLNLGRDCRMLSDETNVTQISNVNTYTYNSNSTVTNNYYYGASPSPSPSATPTASPSPSPIPTPTASASASPTPAPTPSPSASPTPTPSASVHDDNGHGNDPGNYDPSNPGNSKPDGAASASPSPSPSPSPSAG